MEHKHFPPQGQSMIGLHSSSKDCQCNPDVVKIYKAQTSGRGGSHQGRKVVRVDVLHKVIS